MVLRVTALLHTARLQPHLDEFGVLPLVYMALANYIGSDHRCKPLLIYDALGDNAVASRLSGIRSWQVLVAAYTIAGLFGSIAGILLGGRVGAVDLQLAGAFMLPSVAAAVIGGTSIFGGVGTYTGTILGALILGVLQSLLTFLSVGTAVQQMIYGAITILLSWMYARITASQ